MTAAAIEVRSEAVPRNIPQDQVRAFNRALESGYGNGFDLSAAGRPEPMESVFLLDHIEQILKYWVRFPDEHSLVMATLWIAHTWFTDRSGELLVPATPRFMVIAPPESGKTRLLRVMAALSRNAIGPAVGVVTAPGVRNALRQHRAVFLDEAHRIFLGRRLDLQGILTGGYTPGSVTLNGYKGEDNAEDIFGPVAIGAQDRLLDSAHSDELTDLFGRSFITRLKAAAKDDKVPQLNQQFWTAAQSTRGGLALWAAAETAAQEQLWNIHTINDDLTSRAYEISIAPCAVADRAPDYRYPEGSPERLRWAVRAREAVCGMLLGTDDGKVIMNDIRESLERLRELNGKN